MSRASAAKLPAKKARQYLEVSTGVSAPSAAICKKGCCAFRSVELESASGCFSLPEFAKFRLM